MLSSKSKECKNVQNWCHERQDILSYKRLSFCVCLYQFILSEDDKIDYHYYVQYPDYRDICKSITYAFTTYLDAAKRFNSEVEKLDSYVPLDADDFPDWKGDVLPF